MEDLSPAELQAIIETWVDAKKRYEREFGPGDQVSLNCGVYAPVRLRMSPVLIENLLFKHFLMLQGLITMRPEPLNGNQSYEGPPQQDALLRR
jgi:hypothetical protein